MNEDPPIPPGLNDGLTVEERTEEFLRLLGMGCTVREASNAVAISNVALYRRRGKDPAFAKAWEDAQRISVKHLVAEAERRAMRSSDKLLMFLLSAYDPARFRKTSAMELTNPDGSLSMSTEQRAAAVTALIVKARAAKAKADEDEGLDLL